MKKKISEGNFKRRFKEVHVFKKKSTMIKNKPEKPSI